MQRKRVIFIQCRFLGSDLSVNVDQQRLGQVESLDEGDATSCAGASTNSHAVQFRTPSVADDLEMEQ
jgi:hypothetical protein